MSDTVRFRVYNVPNASSAVGSLCDRSAVGRSLGFSRALEPGLPRSEPERRRKPAHQRRLRGSRPGLGHVGSTFARRCRRCPRWAADACAGSGTRRVGRDPRSGTRLAVHFPRLEGQRDTPRTPGRHPLGSGRLGKFQARNSTGCGGQVLAALTTIADARGSS